VPYRLGVSPPYGKHIMPYHLRRSQRDIAILGCSGLLHGMRNTQQRDTDSFSRMIQLHTMLIVMLLLIWGLKVVVVV
jgi:hypothetical protein